MPFSCLSSFARFSATRYDNSNISDTGAHLTNVAVQKKTTEYNKGTGGKWSLRHLKLYLVRTDRADAAASNTVHPFQEKLVP